MGIPAKSIQNGMNKSSEIAQHLYPQLLERVAIINAPWFMKQLWKIARMILSERLTSKAAMCMGQFEPGAEPNRMMECPWASKQLRPEEVPTFVGGERLSFCFGLFAHRALQESVFARRRLDVLEEWPTTTTLREKARPRKSSKLKPQPKGRIPRRRRDGFGEQTGERRH